jgi:hypothetical protein
LKKLDHHKRLLDVRDLVFQTRPSLCQIVVHESVLAALSKKNKEKKCGKFIAGRCARRRELVRKRILEPFDRTFHLTVYSTNMVFDISLHFWSAGEANETSRYTMKGALGMPRGFRSSVGVDILCAVKVRKLCVLGFSH